MRLFKSAVRQAVVRSIVWFAAVLVIHTGACSSDSGPPIVQPPPVTTANISGTVTDGDGPVPGVTVMLDDGETVFAASTVTTGTYRLQVDPGSYDVRVGVAPPARGEVLQLTRVSFAAAGDHRLDLALSSGRLDVSAPPSFEGESVEVGLLWDGSPIASHHAPIVGGHALIEFRALLPVSVLVAVYVPGETSPMFPPGVDSPVSGSYWNLQPSTTSESTFEIQ